MRAQYLDLKAESEEGTSQFKLVPSEWKTAMLPNIPFPSSEKDKLTLEAKVWDVTRDGKLRSYPVLVGKKISSAADVRGSGPPNVVLHLVLQVSVSEFDPR